MRMHLREVDLPKAGLESVPAQVWLGGPRK